MCGLFGIWNLDGKPIDLSMVERATTIMRHRGPDDEGYLLVNSVTGRAVSCAGADTDPLLSMPRLQAFNQEPVDLALGFRRLAIIDLSPAGHQPMNSADGRFWIVFNGQIYNYVELRQDLSERGYDFRTRTDTEVLLASYQQWGEECLSRLNGMWAFVVWDAVERQLFLARDRFGIKPLYYSTSGGKITFASEIKALVGPHGIPFEPDQQSVYRYLVSGSFPSPRKGASFFKGVQALPPGHHMTVRSQDTTKHRYWSLDSVADGAQEADPADAVAEYRSLFTDAVRLRLRADVSVGSCLSGGLDSSSIVCVINDLMAEDGLTSAQIGDRQKTFSAVYDKSAPYNEREHVEEVLRATGADGHFAFPTLTGLRKSVERLVWHQDEPFMSTSMFAQWCVMEEAHSTGMKVLLDGQGADEALAGYRPFSTYLAELIREMKILRALREAKAIQSTTGIPAWSPLAGAVRYLLPDRLMRFVRMRWYARRQGSRMLNPDFASLWDRHTTADCEQFAHYRTLGTHLRHLVEESSLPQLLRYEDRNSMAFGIESRVPYLDHRLIGFAFGKGAPLRIRDGWTKWILRKAMEGTVPDHVLWRRDKAGFETPARDWLVEWLRDDNDLFGDTALSDHYLDLCSLRQEIAQWCANRADLDSLVVWRWVNLELWLRCFSQAPTSCAEEAR